MPDTPQLDKIIRDAVREGIARVHTQVPGRVLEYDHSTQKAKIQLIVRHAFDDAGEVGYYKPAPLVNVPVIFPAILTWPLQVGDPGWVEFAERSTDEYLAAGNSETTPRDLRRFDLSDAVFSPCYLRGEADVADGAAVLAHDEIRLGSSAAEDFVALASLVRDELDEIWDAINGHTHGGVEPGAGFTDPATISGSASDVGAQKVKAE